MKKCINVNCESFSSQPENCCLVRADVSGCPEAVKFESPDRGYSSLGVWHGTIERWEGLKYTGPLFSSE